MSLEPGRELLHYRLVEQIGEGGMGVVWRATDTTLGRDVAIKLLPDLLATDTERLQRFGREARVLASLNHPHIATIHGFHEVPQDTGAPIRFLAMELVEGEDLQQRIDRSPIPLDRTIEIAGQIALALEAAHTQGVIHRDLKPANVKLTADGAAKVLDFGLAKALSPEAASGETAGRASLSPTITSAGTAVGVILGTAAFMSPEQARGRSVDKRADLWAFGCLLYEMLTRRRCFQGETISDTLASVLKEQPDWARLPEDTPPAIHRLLRRCLAKDPRQRLSDAADARLELSEALEPPHPKEHPAPAVDGAPPRTGFAARLPWVVATLAVAAAVGVWLIGGRTQSPPPTEPLELSILIPPDIRLADNQETMLEISPDGRYLVVVGTGTDARSATLYLRDLRDSTVVQLAGTERALNPMFSPDSRWIAFFADGHIKKIPIDGGTPVPICESTGNPRGGSWGGDDLIVYPEHFIGGLVQVPGSGGKPEPLTELDTDRKERTHRWPQIVPGHDVVLFTVATTDSPEFYDDARIDALRLTTGERKTVFEGASFARYVPTGHLVFGRGGFLFAVAFDITRLETTGTPAPVREGVRGTPNSGVVHASIAQNGLLAYVAGEPENPIRHLKWFYSDGHDELLVGIEPGRYRDPTASPDGKSLALTVASDRASDIWVFGLENESRTRLTFEHENILPIWTPDGKSIVFYSLRDGTGAVYISAADGSGGERLLYAGPAGTSSTPQDISADGRLLLMETDGSNKQDIWVKSLVDPEAEVVPFLTGPDDETTGRFSPDGRWIAYSSDVTGDYQVFVRPYPGPGGRWQISNDGGVRPQWSPDGRRLHYRLNRDWWVVDVEPGDGQSFRAGLPRLVRDDLQRVSLSTTHGMSADGQAMLMAVSDETRATPGAVTVVVDWLSELE